MTPHIVFSLLVSSDPKFDLNRAQDIDYSVSNARNKHRMILNDVSGRINRHSMTAVVWLTLINL